MNSNGKKVVIIGGGIAGLCAAVYAQKCGYQAEVLEMNDIAGGLAMSWRRGGYTFETCLHWFYGADPKGAMHAQWAELFDVDRLEFVDLPELAHMESEDGKSLSIPTDPDRLEKELLTHARQDAEAILQLAKDIRRLSKFQMPDPGKGWMGNLSVLLRDLPILPRVKALSQIRTREYGGQFTHPLLRAFFVEGMSGSLSAIAILFSMAWMSSGDAKYAVGGAQAIIRLIEENLIRMGGKIRYKARVEKILVEDGAAVGVELKGGEQVRGDWVISAADGHATIYEMLGGKYVGEPIEHFYRTQGLFPSYLQVSFGVALDLSNEPAAVTRVLKPKIQVDPETWLDQLSFRFFHFDRSFAPAGKTAVTCFLPTRNTPYWVQLRNESPEKYAAEKQRVARMVAAVLEKRSPGFHAAIETFDVSTPASIIRYTGNWKGSMEGWLPTPESGFKPLPNTLPGLRRFKMVGQWISPGGGLPAGPMTARPAIQAICKEDRVPFRVR